MTVDVASFRTKFPQFASTTVYPNDLVDDRIQEATSQVSEDWFGDDYDLAIYYLSAHLLVYNSGGSGVSGAPVSSVTAGSASVTYAVSAPSSGGSEFDATSFGRRYKYLERSRGPGMTPIFTDFACD